MFGFLKCTRDRVSTQDWSVYRSFFCGLCYTLKIEYGASSRLFTNYDAVLLALMVSGQEKGETTSRRYRCPLNPFKTPNVPGEDKALRFAAASTMVMMEGKLLDDAADERGIPRKLVTRLGLALFKSEFEAAAGFLQTLGLPVNSVRDRFKQQRFIEKRAQGELDKLSESTAFALGTLFEWVAVVAEKEENRTLFFEFGHALGKLIYVLDSWNDLRFDIRYGRFNPLIGCLPSHAGVTRNPGQARNVVLETLEQDYSTLNSRLSSLGIRKHESLIKSILENGILTRVRNVLQRRENEHGVSEWVGTHSLADARNWILLSVPLSQIGHAEVSAAECGGGECCACCGLMACCSCCCSDDCADARGWCLGKLGGTLAGFGRGMVKPFAFIARGRGIAVFKDVDIRFPGPPVKTFPIRTKSYTSAGATGMKCPICKDPLGGGEQVTVCTYCGIHHHMECWKWNGGCGGSLGCPEAGNRRR